MQISERIHNIIDDKDIRQKALAKKLNINYSTFNAYMTGRHMFPCDVLAQIALELDTTTDYLLGLTKTPLRPFHVSPAERQFLQGMRSLTPQQKELLHQTLRLMLEQNQR